MPNTMQSVPQMSPFSMNGLPSPGYQCPTSIYQPAPQQVYSLSQTGQQVRNHRLFRQQCLLLLLLHELSKKVTNCISWPVAVFNWWSLQQCLFQQPKSLHTTSPGPSRPGPAAQVFPEAYLFLQVRRHSPTMSAKSLDYFKGLIFLLAAFLSAA